MRRFLWSASAGMGSHAGGYFDSKVNRSAELLLDILSLLH